MFGFLSRSKQNDAGGVKKARDIDRGPTGLLVIFLLILIGAVFLGAKALFYSPSASAASSKVAVGDVLATPAGIIPTAAPVIMVQTVVVTATPSPTPEPTQTPWIMREMVTVPVTVTVPYTVTVTVPGKPIYRDKIVMQTQIVTQTVSVVATPIPLPHGSIELCWRAEGVKEIWLDGTTGVGGSGCQTWMAAAGENLHGVRVLR